MFLGVWKRFCVVLRLWLAKINFNDFMASVTPGTCLTQRSNVVCNSYEQKFLSSHCPLRQSTHIGAHFFSNRGRMEDPQHS